MHRHLKQIFYGFLFLFFWAAIGFLVYFFFFKPATPRKISIPLSAQPIQIVGNVKIFYPLPGSVSLLAQIQNPNLGYVAQNFDYEFQIYGYQNNLLQTLDDNSFIYAGEIKYLSAPNLILGNKQNIGRVDLIIKNVNWEQGDNFQPPLLAIQSQAAEVVGNTLEVSGRLANNDSISFAKVQIIAIFYGQFGQIDGISESELDNLVPGEVRGFSITHPQISGVDIKSTQIFTYARRP